MAERKEKGFTIEGVPENTSAGWIMKILPNPKNQFEQDAWLSENRGKKVKLAREDIRHPPRV